MAKPTNKNKRKNKHHNKNKTAKFKKLNCAPNRGKEINGELQKLSCYNNSELFNFKKIWNSKNPNNLIKTNNPKNIWLFFKNNLSSKCYNELCWIKENHIGNINKDHILKNVFRPFSPTTWKSKPYEWLSSVDILKVMEQYQRTNKNFVFIGPTPIDFDNKDLFGTCIYEQLCKFDINKYYNVKPRKDKIGIIFNTDPHDQPGEHWIALFVDLKKQFVFYFDSNGEKIKKQVDILKNRIIEQGNKINLNLKYYDNKGLVHQKKDGQCGMYTLYFIAELLQENKEPEFFKDQRVPDELMRDYRIKYYNSE